MPSQDGSDAPKKSPLQAFYDRLTLTEADRAELRDKRGLSGEMIETSGFRSNLRSNLPILQSLALEYGEQELVACGLWTVKGNDRKPSAQFSGFGVLGKKKRLAPELLESGDYDHLEEDEFAWDWKENGKCNPLLIPYYGLDGNLIALRPHKGFPKGQKPRLYLAGGQRAVTSARQAVIVEGEFKAAAVQDAVGSDWAVASVPGITQVKNFHVWGDVLAWLKRLGAQTVVVVFDNEEHGDPKLPSFRERLEDRFQAEIWARVCAVRLKGEGYDARVGHLPGEWRDAKGKADWDSALSAFVRAGKPRSGICAAFVGVLQNALRVHELAKAKLFEPAAEQIIGDRVAVLTYEPALPCSGMAEQRLANGLWKLAAGKLREWAGRVLPLAKAYQETWGWYYELEIGAQQREKLFNELRNAERSEHIQFLRLALKGTPSLVASFRIIPHYVLVRPDGGRDRLVELVNTRGVSSGLVALDEKSYTAPRDWRIWLTGKGGYSWKAGERALQALQQDIDHALTRREVTQLVCYGCERPGGDWFLEDCAFVGDGSLVRPDAWGIIWCKARGYTFLRDNENHPRGEGGQSFRMKCAPRMRPGWGLTFDHEGKLTLQENVEDDPSALRELLGTLVLCLNNSYGGHEGALLVSAALAYFAGPEILPLRGAFPGIWIAGEKGSGKTYTAKWLMALHGFTDSESGISFKTSSAVGVQIAMGQYANIPVWGDEYKEQELNEPRLKGVIHAGFNRETPSKWSEDGRPRTIRTSLLVTGETTCENAATMSRFVSAVAARENRTGTAEEQRIRLEWLQDHRQ